MLYSISYAELKRVGRLQRLFHFPEMFAPTEAEFRIFINLKEYPVL